jgi:hypothetical protein
MVDETNPTNQFHPYQAPTATPVSQRASSGVDAMLGRFGVRPGDFQSMRDALRNVDFNSSMPKVCEFAQSNLGKALGAMAALMIGASLIRRRGI